MWPSDGALLITGGLGEIGLHVARAAIGFGVRRLILLGRTPLPPRSEWRSLDPATSAGQRVRGVLELEALGASVHTAAVDVGNEAELRRFARGLRGRRLAADPRGRARRRGAGEPARDRDRSRGVRGGDAAEARSALLLDRLLPDLDVFLTFSSIIGYLGQAGEANYAAANAGLDALVADRRARGLPAVSIAWGVWQEIGLAKGKVTAGLARQGILGFSPEQACSLLLWTWAGLAPAFAVLRVDWAAFRRARAGRGESAYRGLVSAGTGSGDEPALAAALAGANAAEKRKLLETVVRDSVARVLKIAPSKVEPKRALGSLGLSSLLAVELRNLLELALGRSLSATLAWNYPTVVQMVEFLAQESEAVAPPSPETKPEAVPVALEQLAEMSDEDALLALRGGALVSAPPGRLGELSAIKLALMAKKVRAEAEAVLRADPIAIVGLAARAPGAESASAFWQLLREGRDAIRDVPPERWNAEAMFDSNPSAPGKASTRSGGFLERVDGFDAAYFGILPREAERMDPQQRLLLEVALEALDDAGQTQERLRGSRSGVFIASYHDDYTQLHIRRPRVGRRPHADRNAAQRARQPALVLPRSARAEPGGRQRVLVVAGSGAPRLPELAHGRDRSRRRRRRVADAHADDDGVDVQGRLHGAGRTLQDLRRARRRLRPRRGLRCRRLEAAVRRDCRRRPDLGRDPRLGRQSGRPFDVARGAERRRRNALSSSRPSRPARSTRAVSASSRLTVPGPRSGIRSRSRPSPRPSASRAPEPHAATSAAPRPISDTSRPRPASRV